MLDLILGLFDIHFTNGEDKTVLVNRGLIDPYGKLIVIIDINGGIYPWLNILCMTKIRDLEPEEVWASKESKF